MKSALRAGALLATLGLAAAGPAFGQTTIDTGAALLPFPDFVVDQTFVVPTDPFLISLRFFAGWNRPAECAVPQYTVINGALVPLPETRYQCLTPAETGNFTGKVFDSGYHLVASAFMNASLLPDQYNPVTLVFAKALQAGQTYTMRIDGGSSSSLAVQSLYFGATTVPYADGTLEGDLTRDLAFKAVFGADPDATTVTPEPVSLALLGTGLLGLAGIARRRRRGAGERGGSAVS